MWSSQNTNTIFSNFIIKWTQINAVKISLKIKIIYKILVAVHIAKMWYIRESLSKDQKSLTVLSSFYTIKTWCLLINNNKATRKHQWQKLDIFVTAFNKFLTLFSPILIVDLENYVIRRITAPYNQSKTCPAAKVTQGILTLFLNLKHPQNCSNISIDDLEEILYV